MARFRPRKELKIWLYRDVDEEARLIGYCAWLKSTRQLATIIKRAIRLYWSLSEGNLSVLFELFPALESRFKPDAETLMDEFRQMLAESVKKGGGYNRSDNERLERLEQIVLQQANGNTGLLMTGQGNGEGSPKQLAGANIEFTPAATDDDDDGGIVLHKDESAGDMSGFMASLLDFMHQDFPEPEHRVRTRND